MSKETLSCKINLSLSDCQVIRDCRAKSNNIFLSIITVVKNDVVGLIKTSLSVSQIKDRDSLEYIIWINSNSTEEINQINDYCEFSDLILVGHDSGIFDAMNRSLLYASGKYVLFLNARDVILQSFKISQITCPCLVPVQYTNYFGRKRWVKKSKTLKFGMPYCHQGMILPRIGYHFEVGLKYGADYLALLNFDFLWPLPVLPTGLIEYDVSGISTVNRWDSDKWTARVIRDRFGLLWAVAFLSFCILKLAIKRAYDVKTVIFRN